MFEVEGSGDRHVQSQGSRWIAHKQNALQCIISRYGAYIAHLTTLASDVFLTAVDRAQLKGYLQKWQQGRLLFGASKFVCAYGYLPTSCSSKSLITTQCC